MWALRREEIKLIGDAMVVTSRTTFGFEGRRPLRPFRPSVLTTGNNKRVLISSPEASVLSLNE